MNDIDFNSFLPVAVRAWTTAKQTTKRKRGSGRSRGHPVEATPISHILVVDTETTLDSAQGLLFGAFRYCRVDGTVVTTVAEGLIYADDLPQRDPAGYATLQTYTASHNPDVDLTYLQVEPSWELHLVSRREFVDRWLWHVGYPHNNRLDPATVVMFNAPFDLSRLAVEVGEARADMYGGFSFTVWDNEQGDEIGWRPRLAIKALDPKRALKKFRRRERGKHDHAGHLLDVRTLVFVLTGDSHSLDSACAAFGVPGKLASPELGAVTAPAIDYCRQDVAATTALFQAVFTEYTHHPIDLHPTRAYSPASIAKGYLRAMGIKPRLTQDNLSPEVLGHAMAALYGGRAEVHIRNTPVPVALVDFTSMYPTVDILLGLWDLVIAEHVEAVDVTDEVNRLLDTITLEDCFNPERWRDFVVIAELIPGGDILPVRAGYQPDSWTIGLNPLQADQPFWYPLPDLITSKLLSGRTPRIRRALRFQAAGGSQPGLRPVDLRGTIPVDPRREDFFQRVVEERQHAKQRTRHHPEGCDCPDERLAGFLKDLANSGAFGIYAEMICHDQPAKKPAAMTVHGPSGPPFATKVTAPEDPGKYAYPPVAACITGAARLMLALLERSITDAGGTWALCDTDSMAIVCNATGGLVACPGGPHTLPAGGSAVAALSTAEVAAIRDRFRALSPYQPTAVPDLLKLESTGTCFAISAKRYVIYEQPATRPLRLLKRSESGLGQLMDPANVHRDRRDAGGQRIWIDEVWRWIIATHTDPDTAVPVWAQLPALTRITVSSTALWRPFESWNRGRPWPEQIKPFNFLLVATLDPFGYPPDTDPARLRLIAPFSTNPDAWPVLPWRNLYDPAGPTYRITTERDAPALPDLVIVKSYADVLHSYRMHPEHKFLGDDGTPCARLTSGLLQRRPVNVAGPIHLIGKEANRLDDVQAGLVGSLSEVVNDYPNPDPTWFRDYVLPVLDRYSGRELAALLDANRRTIDRMRKGRASRPGLAAAAIQLAVRHARTELVEAGLETGPEVTFMAVLAAWRMQSHAGT